MSVALPGLWRVLLLLGLRLFLPSGRLIAAEPGTGFPVGEAGQWAFSEIVEPGAYPVEVLSRGGAIVAARVVARPAPVVDWRPAQRNGEPYVIRSTGLPGPSARQRCSRR
ncbi:DUF4241 domain-containing protein [Micromonospora sp. NPDC047740]|uniref:DUF4241 domain-containing protein n=1 Tax=Micromonospora sp. NPDC047740 TaxID=3364254 RepID=UPI0037141000